LQNIFADNIVLDFKLVVMNPFLKCFRDKLSAFDHLVKDIQVVFNLSRERRQTNFKNSRNVGKDDTWNIWIDTRIRARICKGKKRIFIFNFI
jgi:hypothetical protein